MVRVALVIFMVGLVSVSCSKAQPSMDELVVSEPVVIVAEESDTVVEVRFTEEQLLAPLVNGKLAVDQYFIISASFSNLANAEKHKKTLDKQGFRSEIIAGKQDAGKTSYKVSYMSFSSKAKAEQSLALEKQKPGHERVWLYEKKQ